ncbi:MAG: acyl-CoA dehydrogenase family protein [Acidimicrobiales bacterium]
MPVVSAVYWGVAKAARDLVVERLTESPKAADGLVQRQVGLMDYLLCTSWWAMEGAVHDNGDDPEATAEAFSRVMLAKRSVTTQALEVVDTAMELAGGASFFKTLPLEQAFRDVRGAKYHPFTPELTLVHAGRLALGQPADDM